MTNKDYITFANTIKEEIDKVNFAQMEHNRSNDALSDIFYSGQRSGIEKMARRIAEICRKDNERFNIEQFLHAAGVQ